MNLFSKILGVIAVVMILVSGIFMVRLQRKQREQQIALVKADSIRAVNDTLRHFQAIDKATIKLLGDSLDIVTTSVAQGNLGKGIGPGTLTSRSIVTGTVKPGMFEVVGVPVEGDTIKHFNLRDRRGPFTLSIDGRYRPEENKVNIDATVELDRVVLRADVTCSKLGDGVNRANIFVAGPTWLTIDRVESTQQAGICNPKVNEKAGKWYHPKVIAGLGWAWHEGGSGPAVFAGLGFAIPLFR